MKRQILKRTLTVCFLFFLFTSLFTITACGNGGGSSGPGKTQVEDTTDLQSDKGVWDQMVWDESHWQ